MKKLMILGASILQVPAIKKAKDMGLYVIAIDIDKDAIGFAYADKSYVISTLDEEAVLDAARKEKIDGIMTIASDRPMMTVAKIAQEMNLSGIDCETALNATNKAVMRKCLQEAKVPIPLFYSVENKKEYLTNIKKFSNKCILKPADNSGSRGIFLIENTQDIELVDNAYDYTYQFSNSGAVLIEEFMEGPEVSVESLSFDGTCKVIAITDKLTTGAPNFVEMGHSQPTLLSKDLCDEIINITKKAVNSLGIKVGPAHTEIIVTEEGPKIVEVGARLGGDNITTHLTPLSTRVDIVKNTILISLGEKIEINNIDNMGAAIRYFSTDRGVVQEIIGFEKANKLDGIKEIKSFISVGSTTNEIKSSNDRSGYIIAQADDAKNAIKICENALDLIQIKVK